MSFCDRFLSVVRCAASTSALLNLYRPHLLSNLHEIWSEDWPNDIFDEFENGNVCLKNMAAKGRGIFPYMAIYG